MAREVGSTAWATRDRGPAPPAPTDLRVLLAIASLLALLAVAVLVAVFLIVSLRNDTADLAAREVRYVQAVHRAALYAKGIANDQRGYLLTGRPVFLREVAAREKQAESAFALAARTASHEGQSLAVEEARIGYARWLRALHADIDAFKAGDRERAVTATVGPTRELRKDYERALELAHVLGVGAIETQSSSVADASSRSVTLLLAYLAIALVIGGAVAFWVVRTVLQPAYALLRVVDDDARSTA